MALKSALEAALERHKMSLSKVDNLRADKLNDAIVRLRENLREEEKILYKKLEERYGEIAKDEDDNFNVSMALNMLKDERKIVRAYTREYKSLQRDEQTLQELIEPPKKIMSGRGGASSTTAYYASMWRLTPSGMRFDAPPNAAGTTEHFESTPSTHIAKYDENGGWYNTANLPVTAEHASYLRRTDRVVDLLRRVSGRPFRDSEGRRFKPYDKFEIRASDYARERDIGIGDAKTILREDALRRGRDYVKSKQAKQQYLRNYYNLSGANNPLRTDRERELFDKTVEFGGGSEGRAMAEEYITLERNDKAESLRRRRRLYAAKREQKANEAYRYDMMDEFDQKMHDLTERYGGDAGKADASLRNMLKKELGPFFKNSRMSTNDLHGLSKNMRMAKGIPLLGRFISNPYAAGLLAAGAIIGEVSSDVKKTSQSNFVSAKQQNKGRIWGKPSKRFTRAAEAAGLSGIEIDNLWGELFYKFGNPEAIENFSSIRPGPQRGFASQSLGLNDDVFFIADYLAGDRTTRSGLRDSVTAKSMVDYIKKYGRSGKDFSTRWLARVWNNPLWLLGLGAVDEASALSAEPGSETWKNMEKAVKDIQSVVYDTEETARAYDTYQQSRADNPSYYDYVTNNNGGSPVSIHIDTAEFNGIENLDGLKNEVSAEANTVKERHATAEAYDPKVR